MSGFLCEFMICLGQVLASVGAWLCAASRVPVPGTHARYQTAARWGFSESLRESFQQGEKTGAFYLPPAPAAPAPSLRLGLGRDTDEVVHEGASGGQEWGLLLSGQRLRDGVYSGSVGMGVTGRRARDMV